MTHGALHAGERPTIERVRAVLGTGSPNTLIRLLDIWWAKLGPRDPPLKDGRIVNERGPPS
jgi:hypothetical protein